MIQAGTRILLVGPDGRKFILKAAQGMLEIQGLGVINGDDICRSEFGSRIGIGGQEFLVLKPSIRDLLGLIERKAQVMIPKDSFMIPLNLDIGCGSKVIEGGVGSGAMTLVLLKTVAPSGKVFSYELREDHAAIARRNIAMSGLEACWELRMGDISTSKLESGADAAVIDIPNPWDALTNVCRALRTGGHVCSYVPNANQLESAVRKMREIGLGDIVSFETIQREMIVHEGGVRPSFENLGHTGYVTFARKLRD